MDKITMQTIIIGHKKLHEVTIVSAKENTNTFITGSAMPV